MLVRPNNNELRMDLGTHELRSFHNDPLGLRYNEPLLLLNGEESIVKEGRALSHTSAITIGQAFLKNLRDNVSRLDPAKSDSLDEQFSSSYIWRTYGNFRSLRGRSGSPLVVSDSGEVLGFQNWEWQGPFGLRRKWGDTDEDLEKNKEEEVDLAVETTIYPFYGSYRLPSAIRGSTIATPLEFM